MLASVSSLWCTSAHLEYDIFRLLLDGVVVSDSTRTARTAIGVSNGLRAPTTLEHGSAVAPVGADTGLAKRSL